MRKYFDSLWFHEGINDLWEVGIGNDKLAFLFKEYKSAYLAIKTANGTTKRINIYNKIMQGTVWAGLICTNTQDGLGKEVYANPALAYKFRREVEVPT